MSIIHKILFGDNLALY